MSLASQANKFTDFRKVREDFAKYSHIICKTIICNKNKQKILTLMCVTNSGAMCLSDQFCYNYTL